MRFEFTSPDEIDQLRDVIKEYVYEAIEIEKAGLKVQFKKEAEPIPDELQTILDKDMEFKNAFESLTPGRQRGYILYFSSAKQSQTRTDRILKYLPKIMAGKGFHDR